MLCGAHLAGHCQPRASHTIALGLGWAPPSGWVTLGPAGARAGTAPPGPLGAGHQVCRAFGCTQRNRHWQQRHLVAATHLIINLLFSPPFRNLQLKLIHKLQPGVRRYK